MVGYLFVIGALAAGVTKGYCGKRTSGEIRGTRATLLFNAVRMLLCIPIGLAVVGRAGALSALASDAMMLIVSAVSGISTALFVVTWIACVRWGAYMMVDVFITLGVVIPTVLSAILFGEAVTVVQILGLLILVFAAYMMCTYNSTLRGGGVRLTRGQLLLLILCGASNGITQFSQKWLAHIDGAVLSVFQFYTYVFAAALLLLCAAWYRPRGEQSTDEAKPNLVRLGIYAVIMAGCLFLHSFCSTAAAGYLPSAKLYPLMQGSSLVLAMLMSSICFGERINLRCIIGIAAAFAAMLCINL